MKELLKKNVLKPIKDAGFDVFFVGGCVRDALWGQTPHDFDIATNATPEDLHKVFDKFSNVSNNSEVFGVTMPLIKLGKGIVEVEIATLRRDITKGRHPKIEFTKNIAEDAARRDFTINALYEDIDGKVIDPTGFGIEDAKNKVLRFVGNPVDRLTEDPLRIYRFVRFLASKGLLSAHTIKEVIEWHPALDFTGVSKERKLKELEKMIGGKYFIKNLPFFMMSGIAADAGFSSIFTEMSNTEQSWKWHAEGSTWADVDGNEIKINAKTDFSKLTPVTHGNVFDHTRRVMTEIAPMIADFDEHHRFLMMMAAILHDVGKAHSQLGIKHSEWDHNGKHIVEDVKKVSDHDKIGAPIAFEFCKNLGMTNEDCKFIKTLVFFHMRMHQLVEMKSKTAIWKIVSMPEFDDLVILSKADTNGCIQSVHDEWSGIENALKHPAVAELVGKPMPKPIVTGQTLIDHGMKPNPKFSKMLGVAYKLQIDKDMTDPEAIYKIVKGVK